MKTRKSASSKLQEYYRNGWQNARSMDWWTHWVLCIPGAIIGSARTFELSCEPHLDEHLLGMELYQMAADMAW